MYREDGLFGRESQCNVMDVPGDVIDIGIVLAKLQQISQCLHKAISIRHLLKLRFESIGAKFVCDMPEYLLDAYEFRGFSLNEEHFSFNHRGLFSSCSLLILAAEQRTDL